MQAFDELVGASVSLASGAVCHELRDLVPSLGLVSADGTTDPLASEGAKTMGIPCTMQVSICFGSTCMIYDQACSEDLEVAH